METLFWNEPKSELTVFPVSRLEMKSDKQNKKKLIESLLTCDPPVTELSYIPTPIRLSPVIEFHMNEVGFYHSNSVNFPQL